MSLLFLQSTSCAQREQVPFPLIVAFEGGGFEDFSGWDCRKSSRSDLMRPLKAISSCGVSAVTGRRDGSLATEETCCLVDPEHVTNLSNPPRIC